MAKRLQYAFYCAYCDRTVSRLICAECGHKAYGYPLAVPNSHQERPTDASR